jgi:hypothetical protein
MKDEITADEIFSEIILLRNVDDKSILLLESDADCNTLDPHLDRDACRSIPAHCKENVIKTVSLADENTVTRVLGLVDRDWIGFGESSPSSQRVFITDDYDLDATIYFISDLADRIIAAHTPKARREAFIAARSVESIMELITAMAVPVGILRWLSHTRSLGLSMRHFPAHMAITDDLRGTDLAMLVEIAYGRSGHSSQITESELLVALKDKVAEFAEDGRKFCCGHDLTCCLMQVLRAFGVNIKIDIILGMGRVALSGVNLKKSNFYGQIQAWADANGAAIWKAA